MSCAGCACNFCANSVELFVDYMTPGESDFPCYTCDECKWCDGDWKKRSQWRGECAHFKEPAKRIQLRQAAADRDAHRRRSMFRVIQGGK